LTTFACLDFNFTVRTSSAAFASSVTSVFGACAASDVAPQVVYGVREDEGTITVDCDGNTIVTGSSPAFALDYLVWHVNQCVMQRSGARFLVHAAAAAWADRALVVPAPSGGGKSTFVAALVRAGFEYMTDECVAIDPGTGRIEGYAKAIGLKRGSWEWFPEVVANFPATEHYEDPVRYATPEMLGSRARTGDATPAVIVVPEQRGAGPVLERLPRADAVVQLVDHSFNFAGFGSDRLPVLGRVVAQCDCYRVDVSDLATAVAALGRVLHAGAVAE
jgi:hypothetical protein